MSGERWLTRGDLTGHDATGLLLVSPDGSSAVPLDPDDRTATASALRSAGVAERDRVVVALAEPYGALWASAAAEVAEAAAPVGPRGRLRLHHALMSVGATTLVITPTGAMDFLARLHLEFLLDPLDLGLRHIVLTGEIASRGTLGQLAGEFDASVSEILASPYSGAALGWRASETAPLTPSESLRLASLDKDEILDAPYPEGAAELVVTRGDSVLRTGQVGRVTTPDLVPAPEHTVGDHVLIRGVWLALPRLEKALAKIDGVATWELTISRPGTLDAATLTVTFNRAALVGNPMWKARIRESLKATTPVAITVEVAPGVAEASRPGTVNDLRGQHLGRDRTAIAH
ncbi:hypothetical protein N5079_27855 [Planotetraspora sp. A-T 1434]|uniref:hypothetical protein n=1 Tax=Planotetraspora sp. A-T 1434 TaxID=2979219 RepID=UPI0021BED50C|nr:hypothetical protein [Planotetraspora sp. A-T 1434]MCT9934031.1 hypothetical protein [Planotetraspora sp. A-T 1434]